MSQASVRALWGIGSWTSKVVVLLTPFTSLCEAA